MVKGFVQIPETSWLNNLAITPSKLARMAIFCSSRGLPTPDIKVEEESLKTHKEVLLTEPNLEADIDETMLESIRKTA